MRLMLVVFVSLLLMSCSESQQTEGNSNLTAHTIANGFDLPISAVTMTNSILASTSAVGSASSVVELPSDIQQNDRDGMLSKVVINKPKYAANDPDAPLEVAVLHSIEEFRAITPPGHDRKYVSMVMPLFSVPKHPKQFPTKEFLESGQYYADTNSNGMDTFESIANLTMEDGRDMDPEDTEALDKEKVSRRMQLIGKLTHMSSIPDTWIDSEGKKYMPVDGDQFGDLAMDYAIGFRISNAGINGRVVLNRSEGFPLEKLVPQNEWKKWPEFQQELKEWSTKILDGCQNLHKCKKAIDWLVMPEHIKGEAHEYSLVGGRKLQYIQALSQRKGNGVLSTAPKYSTDVNEADELQIHLWRIVNSDGTAQVLRVDANSPYPISLVDHHCESQCEVAWQGRPMVVSWKEKTYVIGAYTGGTLHGYVVLEVLSNELKSVGRIAWGS